MSAASKKEEAWRWFMAGFQSVAKDWVHTTISKEEIRAEFETIWRKEPPP